MLFRQVATVIITIASCHAANAQSGCTDPQATNYNPSATSNDGSCVYPVTHNTPALRGVLNPIITESSGLVWTDGKLWTHNDSGNPAEIYSIDTSTGATLQTVVIDNYPNIDWEDITADSAYIYVGDHGNNGGSRTDLKVLKIKKSDITSAPVVHVNAQAISFSYTDQTSFTPSSTHNFDCEALISIRDSLFIFTKDRGDLQTRVYRMPKTPGTYTLTPYTSYNVNGLITGADYNAATNEIILIGYMNSHLNSFLWFLSDFYGDMFFSGNKRRIEIGSSTEWQTEGVAFESNHRFFISCETAGTIDASLFIGQNAYTTTSASSAKKTVTCDVYPNPATDILFIDNLETQGRYDLANMTGTIIGSGLLQPGNNNVNLTTTPVGVYILCLISESGNRQYFKIVRK